jgi:hypothetical protein
MPIIIIQTCGENILSNGNFLDVSSMEIYISTDDNKIYTSNTLTINAFTEYGLSRKDINVFPIDTMTVGVSIDKLLLFPVTHLTNIWHLLHHMYLAFKASPTGAIYPIFFEGFYKRHGSILDFPYKDLLFQGMGYDYDVFKRIYIIFSNKQSIVVKDLTWVNKSIDFKDEPIFPKFKEYILSNMSISYEPRSQKSITFILRKGSRRITNIDYVKERLLRYSINYVFLEDHTIHEQLQIIANTDVLIGVHGAGLTWAVFMKNGSLLIEMYPGNSNTDNYVRWCKIAGVRYKRLPINITKGSQYEFRDATVNLDAQQIREIVRVMM